MQKAKGLSRALGTLLAVAGLMAGTVAAAGEKVGTNIDSRVLLGFQVSDESVQPWLPEDWKLLTLPKGPLAGTNLIVGFFDRKLQLDSEGKPAVQPATLGAELVAFAVKPGEEGRVMAFYAGWRKSAAATAAYAAPLRNVMRFCPCRAEECHR